MPAAQSLQRKLRQAQTACPAPYGHADRIGPRIEHAVRPRHVVLKLQHNVSFCIEIHIFCFPGTSFASFDSSHGHTVHMAENRTAQSPAADSISIMDTAKRQSDCALYTKRLISNSWSSSSDNSDRLSGRGRCSAAHRARPRSSDPDFCGEHVDR